jgi:hypothetical protein
MGWIERTKTGEVEDRASVDKERVVAWADKDFTTAGEITYCL